MTQPREKNFDCDYRPASYWDVPERALANVKGEHRRKRIAEAAADGTLAELPAECFADSVPQEVWQAQGRREPSLMGGETLPDFLEDEVEIARISFPLSVLGDVCSLRARRQDGEILYRLLDDVGGDPIDLPEATSEQPLTFSELTHLLSAVAWEEGGETIIFGKWEWDRDQCGTDPEACTAQIELSSAYYPELPAWYDRQAAEWCREQYAHAIEADEADTNPPLDDTGGVAPHLRSLAFYAAERARERGYEKEPLFTPEGAAAYAEQGHLDRAAACFSALCGKPLSPEKYDHLGPLDPKLFDETYAPSAYAGDLVEQREALFRELPGLVHAIAEASRPDGGLPPLEPDEVEIARVRIGEAPDGLLSLRARPAGRGHRYRLVDDGGSAFRLPFEESDEPLPLPGVYRLLNGASHAGADAVAPADPETCAAGAVFTSWAEKLAEGATLVEARRYTVVSSVHYPMLQRWYDAAASVWHRRYEREMTAGGADSEGRQG